MKWINPKGNPNEVYLIGFHKDDAKVIDYLYRRAHVIGMYAIWHKDISLTGVVEKSTHDGLVAPLLKAFPDATSIGFINLTQGMSGEMDMTEFIYKGE